MDNPKLIKEDVLKAFAQSHFAFSGDEYFTGVPAASKEFNITRSAVHDWPNGREIPEKRQKHLREHRPDIIQKVRQIVETKQVDATPSADAA